MLNKVTLIGYLGEDVDFRNGDNLRAHASLATAERWNDGNGDTQDHTEWHNLTIWGKSAEYFAQLKKGDLIYVEGKLRYRQWEGEDGQTRYRTEIHVDTYRTLRRKEEAPKKSTTRRKKEAA